MTENIAKLQKYNFWDGPIPDTGVKRLHYLQKITAYTGNRLVKVLVGQRRAGKSFLLRQIIKQLLESGVPASNIFYLNKEYTDFDFVSDYKQLDSLIEEYRKWAKPQGKVYLFLDEVQYIDGWERLVNSYAQDHASAFELFISGSNAHLLSGELATLLSGRYVEFEVLPFSYHEFLAAKKLPTGRESFSSYMLTGGLPELFHLPDDEIRRNYMASVRDAILLRDVIQRYHVKDARLLEDIFTFLVNNASNLVSIGNMINWFASKKRKTNYETISNYIGHMRGAFLIHQAERYHIKGKEVMGGNFKYYLNDLSFRNYLYPGFSYGYGYMLENIIYLQLRKAGYKVYVGFLRDREIDFVALKGDRTMYVQVAYLLADEATIDREYSQLENIDDNFEKYVVSLDNIALPNRGGIRHLLAWQFEGFLHKDH